MALRGHPIANFKSHMAHLGVDSGPTRLPLVNPTAAQAAALLAKLTELWIDLDPAG